MQYCNTIQPYIIFFFQMRQLLLITGLAILFVAVLASEKTQESMTSSGEKDGAAKRNTAKLEEAGNEARDTCATNVGLAYVCAACSDLDPGVSEDLCCSQEAVFMYCHDVIDAALKEQGQPEPEVNDDNESEGDKSKRYGPVFATWDWSKLTGGKGKESKRYGSTFGRWGWSDKKRAFEDEVESEVEGISKAKRYGHLFGHLDSKDKRYGGTFTNWGWNKDKRYGSTFNNWGWGGKDKRYGSTFNNWGWGGKDKRYGSTFNNWKWGKRDGEVDKRYGSTFNNWGWANKDKRYGGTFNNWGWNDKDKRYGSTFSNWNFGKRDGEVAKRYGSTFSNWNWGKRALDLAKRYGGTFNRWNWGADNGVDKRYGSVFSQWDWSKFNNKGSDAGNSKSKRYGNLNGRLFSGR